MTKKKSKLVCGVGLNDLIRPVYHKLGDKKVICPIYKVWKSMLVRCYGEKYFAKSNYEGCSVSQEWLRLSSFEEWMLSQDWEGKELDKDILQPNNKIYSPSTCVFIPHELNTFVIESTSVRGKLPIGVSIHKMTGRYTAQCNDPFTGKRGYLGLFDCPNQAHLAWKQKKHEHALVYAEQQTDPRVADALRTRYL